MGGFAYGSFKFFGLYLSQNLSLIAAIIIGALVYALIIYFMKVPEVDSTIDALKKRFLNNKQKEQN
jgi:putative peptidoglycan lipid II flippase